VNCACPSCRNLKKHPPGKVGKWSEKRIAEWKEALIRAFGPEWEEAARRLCIECL